MPKNNLPIPPGDPIQATLEHSDFSKASRSRAALRMRLMQTRGGRFPNRSRGLRVALEITGFAALALFFLFAVTRLVNNPGPVPGATLPAPQPTPTLPATATPQPPTPAPLPELSMDSSPDTVRLAISQPTWKSLWALIQLDVYPTPGDLNTTNRSFSQSWLEQGGRGLLLASNDPVNSQFTLDVAVRTVILWDKTNLTLYDKQLGTTQSFPRENVNQTLNPIAGSNPTLDLVYPNFLMILSSEPRLVRMDFVAGRSALVADWGGSRLWVDTRTGLLLRAERYTGLVGASPLQSVLNMLKVQVDPDLADSDFNPAYLNELNFVQNPFPASSGPTPTPFSQVSPEGWVYFQAAGGAPFEWKIYKLPAGCLTNGTACPEPQALPGNPNFQITGFYWAPDRSLALYSDTNNLQIVGFDPHTGQYPRLVQGFFQSQLYWSPDGKRILAITQGTDAYDMKLVLIQRDGWSVRDIPATLKGEKFVYGWLDDHSLALLVPPGSFKGPPPAWAATDLHPGIYRVDVDSGEASPLPLDAEDPFEASLSPDGKQFVYWKWIDNKASMVVAAVDGTGSHRTGYEGSSPTWSPDGQWIQFLTHSSADQSQRSLTTLYVMRSDGSGLRKVASTIGGFYTLWNPDCTRLLLYAYGPETVPVKSFSVFDPATGQSSQTVLPEFFQIIDLLAWQP